MASRNDGGEQSTPPDVQSRDFANPLSPVVTAPEIPAARPPQHVHYNVGFDKDDAVGRGRSASASNNTAGPDTYLSRNRVVTGVPTSPVRQRRLTRTNTFKSIEDFSEFEPHHAGWHPGSEPGADPYKKDGGHASLSNLSAACQITIVDFSHDQIRTEYLRNHNLEAFLDKPQPNWAKCRWINVNGLSWDVIAALGKHKKLHKLSIEDIMNTRNRTKTDWYANHAFMVFTMLKLAHVRDQDSSDEDSDAESDAKTYTRSMSSNRSLFSNGISKCLRSMFGRTKATPRVSLERSLENGHSQLHLKSYDTVLSTASGETLERTLQRYQAGPNEAKIEFMEKHAALAPHQLGVIAEQVSIFITNDNTIISFFELSADVVEKPILLRLHTEDTVLRQSCDASMVGQAIVDAVIDLALPVASVYADVLGDLELDVLTRPDVTHTKKLYIIISELNKVLAVINPVVNLINALRDHRTEMPQDVATTYLQDPSKGVIITPMTHTYLGDVLDHCVLITDSLNSIKSQADGLISLIFNTISAYQNESMKQLTLATLFFLPLTFITGYFGMNFEPFHDLKNGVRFL